MKKLLLSAMAICAFGMSTVNAQTEKGDKLIEINTGSFATGNTSFSLLSVDGETAYSLGADAGYFIMDNLALKAGFGYANSSVDGSEPIFTYKLGAKYYITGKIPVGVDFSGVSSDGESVNFLGLQGGYAIFVADNVSIEPAVRYNMTMDDKKADSMFQGMVGFVFHF